MLEKLLKISAVLQCPVEQVADRVQSIASTRSTWTADMVADDMYFYIGEQEKLPTLEEFESWLQEQTTKWVAGQIRQVELKRNDRP